MGRCIADRDLDASVVLMADMTCIAPSEKNTQHKRLALFESRGVLFGYQSFSDMLFGSNCGSAWIQLMKFALFY